MKVLILIIFLILIFIIVKKKYNKKENFINNNDTLLIKKNNNYSLIYKNKQNNLYIWEIQSLDNYFPVGQKITNTKSPPIEDDILVNINFINVRPIDFTLISITDDGCGIWRPICPNNYGSMSDIFSKNKPSKNRIKLLPTKYLQLSKISNINTIYKSKISNGFNLWNIYKSDYFFCNDLTNLKNKINNQKIYSIDTKKIQLEKKILIKKTNNYKKLFSNNNFAIWRPIPSKDYRILGDIILQPNIKPYNIKVPTVYKSFTKPIIDYNDVPISSIHYKNKTISLWKPRCNNGYSVLGNVFSVNDNEPLSNIIYSIPLEYLTLNKDLKISYTPVYNNKNKYSIWSNNNFCVANNNYDKPKDIKYLNYDFCEFEKDILDISKEIQLSYNSTNNLDLTNENILFIKNQLSQRTGVPEYRFNNLKMIDNKITLNIESKSKNSEENTINEIIDTLQYLISKNNLKIYNDEIQLNITNLFTNYNEISEKININNKAYIKKID